MTNDNEIIWLIQIIQINKANNLNLQLETRKKKLPQDEDKRWM